MLLKELLKLNEDTTTFDSETFGMAMGETFKDLTLREIRPDGMVLEFRGQRFFYPRAGH